MKLFWTLCVGLLLCAGLQAQELKVNVTINTPKLQTADESVFEDLEKEITEFLNNQKWTNDVFEEDERIKTEIVLTISEELSQTSFKAEMSIQSVRPVYGSNYETALLTHQDKDIVFTYNQFQPLEYTENVFTDNLTAILAFYAYIVIGMDYDSFSPFGGEPYFQKAQDIVNNIPPTIASQVPGWRSTDSNRNRYWIVENLLTPRTRPYRQAMYDYHRQGLDVMHKDVSAGLAMMTNAIEQIGEVNRNYPNAMIIQMFANAKRSEIIEIFKGASSQQLEKVISVMQRADPSNASEYRKLRAR
ncbi:MAG: DUF4835 family protein [Bacteroidetes bacterium]|nr:MAG: DUF4835 family protein [Bacteroidota bacterium]